MSLEGFCVRGSENSLADSRVERSYVERLEPGTDCLPNKNRKIAFIFSQKKSDERFPSAHNAILIVLIAITKDALADWP